MKRYKPAIFIATGYLFFYLLLFEAGAPLWVIFLLFLLSPLPVIYMAFQILTNAVYNGRELENDEEFGYQDIDKANLGLF